jgi:hypothetical protein
VKKAEADGPLHQQLINSFRLSQALNSSEKGAWFYLDAARWW